MIVLYKAFLLWWKDNPIRGVLCVSVCFAHLFLLHHLSSLHILPQKNKETKLLVRTLSPKSSASSPSSMKTATTPPPPKKQKPPPPLKKPEPKQPSPPKPAPKKPAPVKPPEPRKPVPHKNPAVEQKKQLIQESLKKIEKSIAQIETKNDKMKEAPSLKVPSKVDIQLNFAEDVPSSQEDTDYILSLVSYLQEYLQLPDVGEVRMELTLHPDGKVKKMRVLSSKSDKNKKRLEEQLPRLHFPVLQRKTEKSDKTFILTFCNEL